MNTIGMIVHQRRIASDEVMGVSFVDQSWRFSAYSGPMQLRSTRVGAKHLLWSHARKLLTASRSNDGRSWRAVRALLLLSSQLVLHRAEYTGCGAKRGAPALRPRLRCAARRRVRARRVRRGSEDLPNHRSP